MGTQLIKFLEYVLGCWNFSETGSQGISRQLPFCDKLLPRRKENKEREEEKPAAVQKPSTQNQLLWVSFAFLRHASVCGCVCVGGEIFECFRFAFIHMAASRLKQEQTRGYGSFRTGQMGMRGFKPGSPINYMSYMLYNWNFDASQFTIDDRTSTGWTNL